MRPSNKSRSRNKNQNRRTSANVINRVFDSSGPEGKVRGTPQQIIEKYQALARDAQLAGDRVAAENFQQHSEHYTRLLGEAMREQNQKREAHEAQQAAQQAQNTQRREAQNGETRPAQNQPQQATPAQSPVLEGSDQPDVVELATPSEGGGSGLVETPENKPRRRRGKPTEKPADTSGAPEKATG
jgi:uncharacterized protein DUF4167